MKAVEFCYWLQGYFELIGQHGIVLTGEKTDLIQKHLNMVFIHDIDKSYPTSQQEALNKAHQEPIDGSGNHSNVRC